MPISKQEKEKENSPLLINIAKYNIDFHVSVKISYLIEFAKNSTTLQINFNLISTLPMSLKYFLFIRDRINTDYL